jgi:hypothetical protein
VFAHAEAGPSHEFDVVIYGATPAGIAAAIPIVRRDPDRRVALVTRYRRVGGLMTNGLTHPDFRTFEGRTGLFLEVNQRVERYYAEKYGPNSEQVKDSLSGTHAEPEVNHIVLREMLDALPGISVLTEHRLQSVEKDDGRIVTASFETSGSPVTLSAKYFVDATYEGDLMAAAGVAFRVGREARDEYGESLAPAEADGQVQGYNFRLTMTDVPENIAPVPRPDGYQREDYRELVPLLEDGSIERIFGDAFDDMPGGIYKRQTPKLPNCRRDINDVSRGVVRLSLPDISDAWPDGDAATRDAIFAEHVRHNVGMLYFLQHDEAVPARFREEAQRWGFCRDEYVNNQHLPEQLYVREARRMLGRHVFIQRDTDRAPGSEGARAVFQPDAIAMGDYGLNCHGTNHEGPRYGGEHTGEFYKGTAPYQIPYGTILPINVDNLAVPVACSASHVGFCALRLEPIWMSLGQAAGEAIGLALESDKALSDVSPAAIRERLHHTGAATIYTSDVPEDSPDFAAVQWWGSLGGFVALDKPQEGETFKYGQRGERVIGQYYAAFPNHAVELAAPLDENTREAWMELAGERGLSVETIGEANTRGEFIRRLWRFEHQGEGS